MKGEVGTSGRRRPAREIMPLLGSSNAGHSSSGWAGTSVVTSSFEALGDEACTAPHCFECSTCLSHLGYFLLSLSADDGRT